MPRLAAAHLIFFLSGIAGLGYQFVWIRMFSVGLGHEMPSTLAVVAAFFGGLALGAWWIDRRSEPGRIRPDESGAITDAASTIADSTQNAGRLAGFGEAKLAPPDPKRAARTYAILEIIIGLWALATILLIPWITDIAPRLIGVEPSPLKHWLIAFALPLVALLPATAAMGATLPVMERFVAPLTKHHRVIGGLYAANTLGAVAGILLTTYVLAPDVGFRAIVALLALTNLFCAVATVSVMMMANDAEAQAETATFASLASVAPSDRASGVGGKRVEHSSTQGPAPASPNLSATHLNVLLFVTGLLGIAYEVVAVRVLNHVLQNTVYTYAAALCVYLLGTAIGAAMYQRFGAHREQAKVTAALVSLLACAVMVGIALMRATPSMYGALRDATSNGGFLAEAVVASRALLLPTIAMGAMFSHLVQRAATQGTGVGRAAAINTLGAAFGPALAIVALAASEDIRLSLYLIALGYWGLATRFTERRWYAPLAISFVVALTNGPRLNDLNLGIDVEAAGTRLNDREGDAAVTPSPGSSPRTMQLISRKDGVMCSVAVVEARSSSTRTDRQGDQDYRILRVNGQFDMGSTAPAAVALEKLQGHIPLLLHPAPKRALFLGLGTGITFGTAALHPGLTADGVELVPEIVEALPYFAPHNNDPTSHPRLRVITADARRFVRATEEKYDVIVADLFHPSHDGAAMLYTVEHFRAIRARLNEGGVFVQWLPLYQADENTWTAIGSAFRQVFDSRRAIEADFSVDLPIVGLIGTSRAALNGSLSTAARREALRLNEELKQPGIRLDNDLRLYGREIEFEEFFDPEALSNTDDFPQVLFASPHSTNRRTTDTHALIEQRLLHAEFERNRAEIIVPATPDHPRSPVYLFRAARDHYMFGLIHLRRRQMTESIDRFIASAAASPDFTLGYAHAVTLAVQAAKDNPGHAKSILQRLDQARPENPTARELLRRLQLNDAPARRIANP